ncbi:hypothetical protein M0813_20154 [Anaeramoeba flamelloides]|uniref:Uncharacterized protein n=1 Tax=Anaeramoeba flamelloides TaxID=1746091 RepID=A0ABQ8YMA9_9EUKA|nr:hypothetical protein M0813_20154 [Anaeramoeba flamelloides]
MVTSGTEDDQKNSQICVLQNGNYVITWYEQDDDDEYWYSIRAQIFDSSNQKVGSQILLKSAETTLFEPHVCCLPNGNFVIVWNDEDLDVIDAQIFEENGDKIGSEFRVNSEDGYPRVCCLANDNFVVAWRDSRAIKAQMYDGPNSKVGELFTVTTEHDTLFDLKLSSLLNNEFAFSYITLDEASDEYGASAQIYDGPGSQVVSEFDLYPLDSDYDIDYVDLCCLDNGILAFTFTKYLKSDDQDHIFARMVNSSDLNQFGNAFQVSSDTDANNLQSSIVCKGNSSFTIIWRYGDSDQSYYLKGQAYDGKDSKVGSHFEVTETKPKDQLYPEMCILKDGNLVVTWTSENSDNDIYAQQFYEGDAPNPDEDTSGSNYNYLNISFIFITVFSLLCLI